MSNSARNQVIYYERVVPKWTSFLPILLIFPTFWLTLAPINELVGVVSGIVVTAVTVLIMILSSPIIRLEGSILRVGSAQISVKLLGRADIAPPGDRLASRIPDLDARAFLALQNSRKGLIKLEIKDANDPTPYWLFSTGDPKGFVAALEQLRKAS
jgi:hypothetical protein